MPYVITVIHAFATTMFSHYRHNACCLSPTLLSPLSLSTSSPLLNEDAIVYV
jgi:hypothetical protein